MSRPDDDDLDRLLAVQPLTAAASRSPGPAPQPKPRGNLPLFIEREPRWKIVLAGIALIAILAAFAWFTSLFHIRAHPGVDQNAYLVAGKNLAATGSAAIKTNDAYAFVGNMWIATDSGAFHPKYPVGMPVVIATVLKIGEPHWVYWISPVAMMIGLLGVFMLARTIAGSLAGLLATLILAASPLTLALANNPNSHAAAFCFTTWGMYFLIRWWQRMGTWRAILAGLLLGYAATIRHTEGLLGGALILVLLMNHRRWGQSGALLLWWLVPIGVQLGVSYFTVGSLTGYDSTRESAAFDRMHLAANWEMIVRQLNGSALFFVLPVGVLGLTLLLARSWKLALILWLWFLPATLLYMAYYWAPETQGIGILRFFFTAMPPIAIGAAWCLTHLAPAAPYSNRALRWFVAPLAAVLIVIGGGAYGIYAAIPMLQADHRRAATIHQAERESITDAKIPPGSVVFAPREILHHLQFIADVRTYESNLFTQTGIALLQNVPKDQPTGFQRRRAEALVKLLGGKSDDELAKIVREIMAAALKENRGVFVIRSTGRTAAKNPALEANLKSAKVLCAWTDIGLAALWKDFGGPLRLPAVPDQHLQWELLEVTSTD